MTFAHFFFRHPYKIGDIYIGENLPLLILTEAY